MSLKQLKLTQHYVTWTVLILLCICIVASVAVTGCTWIKASRCLGGISWNFELGSPAWDFTKSWTSTATLVGAIISTALTLSALPELTKYASKSGYSVLALLISFAVIVAPFVFIALRRGAVGRDEATKKLVVVYQGYLWAFLLSCMITIFAGLAQLVVWFLLLDEVFKDYPFWFFSLLILTFLLGVGLCRYARDSMFLTIKLQRAAEKEAAGEKAIQGAKRPLLTWPVL